MKRALLATVLLSLASCDEDGPDQLCERLLVNRDGTFAELVSETSRARFGTQGEALSVTVFAPISSCVSDVLRASVELYDARNAPVESKAVTVSAQSGVVRANVVFTPQSAGSYLLRVSFEPSLGARNERIDIVARPALDAGLVVTLPVSVSSCLEPVWPVSGDSVACEGEGARVDVFSADGGVQTFSGQHLVVAGGALWSIAAAQLERRVFEDGVLRLTHQADGFPARLTPAMHGADFALRVDSFDRLTLVTVADGGLTKTTTRHGQRSAPAWFFSDDARVYLVDLPDFPACTGRPDCDELGGLFAVEPGLVWRRDVLGLARLDALLWPLSTTSTPVTSLDTRALAASPPQGPFELLPLWVEAPASPNAGDAVLARWLSGALWLSRWPHSRVLRVGGQFIALSEEGDRSVRLIPLQPP